MLAKKHSRDEQQPKERKMLETLFIDSWKREIPRIRLAQRDEELICRTFRLDLSPIAGT
jgi:hypothetical protein